MPYCRIKSFSRVAPDGVLLEKRYDDREQAQRACKRMKASAYKFEVWQFNNDDTPFHSLPVAIDWGTAAGFAAHVIATPTTSRRTR